MRAWMVTKGDGGPEATLLDSVTDADLGEDGVLVDVEYSSIKYKDGMALAGRPRVIRKPPLIPGIDLVGTVADRKSTRLNSSHVRISYAVFCLKKKTKHKSRMNSE